MIIRVSRPPVSEIPIGSLRLDVSRQDSLKGFLQFGFLTIRPKVEIVPPNSHAKNICACSIFHVRKTMLTRREATERLETRFVLFYAAPEELEILRHPFLIKLP